MDSVAFTGGEFAWKANPISVDSTEVSFNRKAIKQDGTEDSKTKPLRWLLRQQSLVGGSSHFYGGGHVVRAALEWTFLRTFKGFNRRRS